MKLGRVWEQPAASIFFQSEDKSKQFPPERYPLGREIPTDRNVVNQPRENMDCNAICLKDTSILVF
jgi:hypothetical protein